MSAACERLRALAGKRIRELQVQRREQARRAQALADIGDNEGSQHASRAMSQAHGALLAWRAVLAECGDVE